MDDPISPADARDKNFNSKAADWFTVEVVPRLNDKASSIAVLVMQRLAKDDLCGAFFQGQPRKTLEFTAVNRTEERWKLPDGSIFVRQPRTVLNPKTETLEQIWEIYRSMPFDDFACQYLQDTRASYDVGLAYYEFDTTDWTPEKGDPKMHAMFSNEWYVLYECFGVGKKPPYLSKAPLTPEQRDASVIYSQAKLLEEAQKDIDAIENEFL